MILDKVENSSRYFKSPIFVEIFKKIMHLKGILNICGPSTTVYKFAKKYNKNIKKKYLKKNKKINLPINASMNLSKLKKLIS